jgi:pimeloyl-ACP methyl ester carboxylesterase
MHLVFLHALPFDGTMWANEMELLPGKTIAPTLYAFGESIENWAQAVLELTTEEEFVVVGNSVGGSCALEVARQAPQRVRAIVVIGAKAGVRPDPVFRDEALRTLREQGMEGAWPKYWAGLFGANAHPGVIERARLLACSVDIGDVARGVKAFHDRRDLTDFARSWQKPLVVIRGDQDRTPDDSSVVELASSPLGELQTVEDAGHYASLEQPMKVHAIIRSVLARSAWAVEDSNL